MQVGSNRVWDYVGDNFVHRLVQNKTDGKLVELDGQDRNGQDTKTVVRNAGFAILTPSAAVMCHLFSPLGWNESRDGGEDGLSEA